MQRKARVSARVMYVRVDVRMCVCSRARVRCVREYVRVRVYAVCRNQWKRVEEAAWQERTVGRRTKSGGGGGDGWQSVGRRVG